MRYPEFLKPGGTIGFIAPSFSPVTEPYKTEFAQTRELFEAQGYKTVCGPNCFRSDGIGKSSTPENCGAEINDFFINDRADVIISCSGGETMCEDLPFVDFEAIAKSKPHWYLGYSDNTNLTFTLPTLCDTAAIYGPCACTYAMKPRHESVEDAFRILTGEKLTEHNYDSWELQEAENAGPCAPFNLTEPFRMVTAGTDNGSANFSGRLIGGCLDVLLNLVGTRFDRAADFAKKYADDGIIWFMEAFDLSPLETRRAIWQMKYAGWFENARGFLIGRPVRFGESVMGMDNYSAVTGALEDLNVPVLMDLDIGHHPPMMPLISGSYAEVKAAEGEISIDMKLI